MNLFLGGGGGMNMGGAVETVYGGLWAGQNAACSGCVVIGANALGIGAGVLYSGTGITAIGNDALRNMSGTNNLGLTAIGQYSQAIFL